MFSGVDMKNRTWKQIELGYAKDLTQKKFGYLQPLYRVTGEFATSATAYWLCQCDCGNQIIEPANMLNAQKVVSCGCFKKELLSETKSANLIGQRFGYLTILERMHSSKHQKTLWKCQCDCGNIVQATTGDLRQGHIQSCGCLRAKNNHDRTYQDLTGQQFGELHVLYRDESKMHPVHFYCQCSCGKYTSVLASALKSGSTRTCGCGQGLSNGERIITQILTENNINFLFNKNFFPDLILPSGGIGRYDFILLDDNNKPVRLIEFDGIQHYKPTSFYFDMNAKHNLEYVQTNDKIKNQYALSHNLPLVRIPYTYLKKITLNTLLGDQFLIRE